MSLHLYTFHGMPEQMQNLSNISSSDAEADKLAAEAIFPIVYEELKRHAARCLGAGVSRHTLQPTALVHEVFLRLADQTGSTWRNRAHFLALSSRIMRQILVDHARKHLADKRGGGWKRISLAEVDGNEPADEAEILALDEALNKLAQLNPRHATMIELRFLGGLSIEEAAAALDISPRTIKSDWRVAKAWLLRELKRGEEE